MVGRDIITETQKIGKFYNLFLEAIIKEDIENLQQCFELYANYAIKQNWISDSHQNFEKMEKLFAENEFLKEK